MEWLIPLVTLTAMEIVLGIDNIVFISILVGRLPEAQRATARTIGLAAAMIMRLLLLFSISWVLRLDQPLFLLTDLGFPSGWLESFTAGGMKTPDPQVALHHFNEINQISIRDLILLGGGLFLIGNSVVEIHHKIEGHDEGHQAGEEKASFRSVLFQIAIIDLVFSLDSVITAVGMAKEIWIMCVAVIVSILIMMAFAGTVERFVTKHPTIKILALSFLILIGVLLVAEGVGTPVNKGYIYFAMAFSLVVELLNIRLRTAKSRTRLRSV